MLEQSKARQASLARQARQARQAQARPSQGWAQQASQPSSFGLKTTPETGLAGRPKTQIIFSQKCPKKGPGGPRGPWGLMGALFFFNLEEGPPHGDGFIQFQHPFDPMSVRVSAWREVIVFGTHLGHF